MDLVRLLRDAGLTVADHRRSPASGPFTPLGVVAHHTAGPRTGEAPSLRICINGKTGVPGPLCQALVGRSGTVYVITDGKANHAGLGDGRVLERLRTGLPPLGDAAKVGMSRNDTGGNTWFYGWEIENAGTGGDPYPAAQVRAVERMTVAVAKAARLPAYAVIGHKEWTSRKIDPAGWSMPALRATIAAALEDEEEDVMQQGDRGPRVAWWQARLDVLGFDCKVTQTFDPATVAATKAFQSSVGLEPDGRVLAPDVAELRVRLHEHDLLHVKDWNELRDGLDDRYVQVPEHRRMHEKGTPPVILP